MKSSVIRVNISLSREEDKEKYFQARKKGDGPIEIFRSGLAKLCRKKSKKRG